MRHIFFKWLEKFNNFNFKTIKYNIMNRNTKTNEDFLPKNVVVMREIMPRYIANI